MGHGPQVWDAIGGAAPITVFAHRCWRLRTSGRVEKGYRLMGAELESEYNPVEAGLARPKVKAADFIGKEAYLAARENGPDAICAPSPSKTTPTARVVTASCRVATTPS